MNRVTDVIVNGRKWIVGIYVLLSVIMIVCLTQLHINYNMQDYLPKDANSTKAISVMAENFDESIANTNVMICDVDVEEALAYEEQLKQVAGVEDVMWLDTVLGEENLSQMILPDNTLYTDLLDASVKEKLEGYYKERNALFQVTVANGQEKQAVNAIYNLIGERGAMTGTAVEQAANQNLAMQQTVKAIALIAPLILVILILSTKSFIEPFLYLTAIGTAVLINLGICAVSGQISYVTLAVAPLLQMAVSLDYAVFLSHSFDKYRQNHMSMQKAMKFAMKDSLKSISASCLTTLFGFAALLFMNFKIGPDMGLALVRGVAFSFLAVMTLLPALMLCTHKLNDKFRHKDFLPAFHKISRGLVKVRIPALVILMCVVIGAYVLQKDTTYFYGSGEPSTESRLAQDTAHIEEIFGKSNRMAILVPVGDESAELQISETLATFPYVESVMSYANTVGFDIPKEYVPQEAKKSFYSEYYARIIVTTTLENEGDVAFAAVEEVKNLVYTYYEPDTVYMAGNSINMYDMKNTVEADNKRVGMITLIAIFLVLLVEFRSLLVPIILIVCVKGSIWLTMALSGIAGAPVCYIGYLVVSTVMMGATIDYAILITDNYIKNRSKLHPGQAMQETLSHGMKSILVSALTLAVAGFALGFSTSEGLVRMLGLMLGKGAVIAFLMSITLLPAVLMVLDGLIPLLSYKIHFCRKETNQTTYSHKTLVETTQV